MIVRLIRVECKRALDLGGDKPLWFIHGLTTKRVRYVYRHLFSDAYTANVSLAKMTNGNGHIIVQLAGQWIKTTKS